MTKRTRIILLALVLALMLAFSTACGSDSEGEVTKGDGTKSEAPAEPKQDFQNLSIGDSYEKGGAKVTVVAVEDGGKSWGNDPLIKVTVTYLNNSDKGLSFNPYDWSVQSNAGARTDSALTDAKSLDSGELAPGGTVTGDVYLKAEDAAKIIYTSNMFLDGEDDLVMWNIQ